MLVITVSCCPPSLRGDLSKWLFEIDTGVYVGNPGKRVRENLWQRVKATIREGRAVFVCSSRCEQGLEIRTYQTQEYPKDFDGMQLMFHPTEKEVVPVQEKPAEKIPVYTREQLLIKIQKEKRERVMPDAFVVLDFETTGLDPESDEITEIGALKVEQGNIVDCFTCLVQVSCPVAQEASRLTGITADLLEKEGLDEQHALRALKSFCAELPVVCHNARFDLQFLKKACQRQNIPFWSPKTIDTLQLARKYIKDVENYRLVTLLHYFGIEEEQKHRALSDCKVTLKMVEKLNEIAQK